MSAAPSYKTLIQLATGTNNGFSEQATEWIYDAANQRHGFRMISELHRNIIPDSPLIVRVNGTIRTPDFVDYPTGTVWFEEYQGTSSANVVTLSGNSFKFSAIGGAKSYSLEIGGDILDETQLAISNAPVGAYERGYGLLDVTASVEGFHRSSHSERFYRDKKMNREIFLLRIYSGTATTAGSDANATYYVGYFVIENLSWSGDVGDLEGKSLNFSLARFDNARSKSLNHFAFVCPHDKSIFKIPTDYNFTVQLFDPADSGIISLSDVDLTDDAPREIVFDYRSIFHGAKTSNFLVVATPTELEFDTGASLGLLSVRPDSVGKGSLIPADESGGELRLSTFKGSSWNAETPLAIDVTHSFS